MKTLAIIAAAAFQVLVLVYMAGEREWILHSGRTVYLRTAPIDPRDAMRGEYVRLSYEISRVPASLCRDGLVGSKGVLKPVKPDTCVYASLRVNEDGLAELVSLSDRRPAEGLFLKGYATGPWTSGYRTYRAAPNLDVRYGIEAYFMQQGKAAALDKSRLREGIQVPLELAVAVSPGGTAVLKGYRWSSLGIGLELEQSPAERGRPVQGGSPLAATVRLLNAGDKDLAVVDLPGSRSLAMVPDSVPWGQENTWRWAHEDESQPRPEPAHVIVLKPGQTHKIRVDFKDPAWFIVNARRPKSAKPLPVSLADRINGLDWSARFRFEYRPPDRAACQGLPHADLIWHGRLPSAAFSGRGVD